MKTYNKVIIAILGLSLASNSLMMAIKRGENITESQAKASILKPSPAKLGAATLASMLPIVEMLKGILEVAIVVEDPVFKKAIEAMQPVAIAKATEKKSPEESAQITSKALNDFLQQMQKGVLPIVKIFENFAKIIENYGKALINPEATIKGEPAINRFNRSIMMTHAVLRALESLSILAPQLTPKATTTKPEEELERHKQGELSGHIMRESKPALEHEADVPEE